MRLKRLQRRLSRKQKFSRNWVKAKARIQKLQSHIGNVRRDHIHKTSHAISKNHAIVVVEDLRIRNMSASAAGTNEAPGRNGRAKAGLNRSILDQGWFEFRRQLDYKLDWRGGELLAVPAYNTSRTCSCCGNVAAENRQTQAVFQCVSCGYRANADTNAARNILAAGHAALACGERAQSGRSLSVAA
jgi:putative transposase